MAGASGWLLLARINAAYQRGGSSIKRRHGNQQKQQAATLWRQSAALRAATAFLNGDGIGEGGGMARLARKAAASGGGILLNADAKAFHQAAFARHWRRTSAGA